MIPLFVTAVAHTNETIALEACEILKQMTPPAVPGLMQATSNRNERVQSLAAAALRELVFNGRLQPEIFRSMLSNDALVVRLAGACTLHHLGEDPVPLLPVLVEAIKNGDHDMRGSAFTVLGLLGPAAKPAVHGPLVILTNAGPEDVRFDTVWALGKSIQRFWCMY